jgi:hypothetical protein
MVKIKELAKSQKIDAIQAAESLQLIGDDA